MKLYRSIVFAVLLLGVLFPLKTYAFTSSVEPNESESTELKNAIEVWRQQADVYKDRQQSNREIETRLTIAESLLRLGKFDEAIAQLHRVKSIQPLDTAYLARTDKQLGDVYAEQGNYQRAVSFYLESLTLDKTLPTLNNIVKVLLDRRASLLLKASRVQRQQDADTFQSQAKLATAQAEKYAAIALAMAESKRSISAVQALINWHTLPKQTLNKEQLDRGSHLIDRLPPSPQKLMTVIDWAKVDRRNQEQWLQRAMNQAQDLQNPLLTSYASLELGKLYLAGDKPELAQKYATQSVEAAGDALNYNSLFRAQELLARINLKRERPTLALNAYREAIISIEQLNKDSSLITPLQVVTFNQQLEPIYRNTLSLILDEDANQKELIEAKEVSDKLRLVQLRRYFGDNCLEVTTAASDAEGAGQAGSENNHPTINSIVLEDRLVTLLELPDGSIKQHTTKITQEALQKLVSELSLELINGVSFSFRRQSRQLYQMLLAPFEYELEAIEPETVVFINDGILRNVPMAVLIDKQDRYVAEKWATINSLGLNYRPQSSLQKSDKLESALALGLPYTPYEPDVAPLPYVPEEVNAVEEIFGGKKMLGKNFTANTLSQQLAQESYPLVHLATHGYFGGTAETSYIYAYDRRISLLQLDQMLRDSQQSAPELLVLSACETALGNDLSLLGLGGLATRRGIDTTLGSLWFVQDEEQAAVIQEFYRRIEEDNQPLAIALQQIQQQLIEQFAHPSIWASLILIGET